MHSLLRYSGAKSRIARPKFRRVTSADSCAIASNSASLFGSSSAAKRRRAADGCFGKMISSAYDTRLLYGRNAKAPRDLLDNLQRRRSSPQISHP